MTEPHSADQTPTEPLTADQPAAASTPLPAAASTPPPAADPPTPSTEPTLAAPIAAPTEPPPSVGAADGYAAPVSPATASPTTTKVRTPAWLNAILAVAVVIAVGGVGFALGRITAPTTITGSGSRVPAGQLPNDGFPGGGFGNGGDGGNGNGNGNGQDGNGNRGPSFPGDGVGAGLTIEGTVQSVDADSLTVQLASGRTVEVALDANTTYTTQTAAAASAVTTGSKVTIGVDRLGFADGAGAARTATAGSVSVLP